MVSRCRSHTAIRGSSSSSSGSSNPYWGLTYKTGPSSSSSSYSQYGFDEFDDDRPYRHCTPLYRQLVWSGERKEQETGKQGEANKQIAAWIILLFWCGRNASVLAAYCTLAGIFLASRIRAAQEEALQAEPNKQPCYELAKAAYDGELERAQALLAQGVSPKATNVNAANVAFTLALVFRRKAPRQYEFEAICEKRLARITGATKQPTALSAEEHQARLKAQAGVETPASRHGQRAAHQAMRRSKHMPPTWIGDIGPTHRKTLLLKDHPSESHCSDHSVSDDCQLPTDCGTGIFALMIERGEECLNCLMLAVMRRSKHSSGANAMKDWILSRNWCLMEIKGALE
eukprot:g38773.t1